MSLSVVLRASITSAALCVLVCAADDPFAGTWKLNTAKSKYDANSPAAKAVTVRIEPEADMIKVTVEGTDAQDQPMNFSYSAKDDGTPGTVTGSPQMDSVTLKRADPNTLNATATKEGKTVFTDKRVVSKDGKTMTMTRTGTTADGKKFRSTIVMDKQ